MPCRHGSRLDAADKSWHLTSPTPYDPPLTYGGFSQARQVGNQISSILEQAKAESERSGVWNGRRKRFKVVIHSSPFLRCVQTSIGISAGLAQTTSDAVVSNLSELIVPREMPQTHAQFQFKSTLLRLDSFLGEWLSPEYFEMITPPPGQGLMLAAAKAELLRRADYSAYTTDTVPRPAPQPRTSSGSLWQSPVASPASSDSDFGVNVFGMAGALPAPTEPRKGFMPLRPLHGVASNRAIPEGFVAHARDSCVTVDYQWDSMRAPLDFGDGGKFGEEWPSMHKRFRGGIRKLVNWYAAADSPADTLSKMSTSTPGAATEELPEEDVETVVVLVSHGAGCNALIGAITHQPVLMDIGIASLTMATRKPNISYEELLANTPPLSDPSIKTLVPVHQLYDMRMSASTEHLRVTSAPTISRSSTPTTNAWNSTAGPRGRTATMGGPVMSPFTYSDPFAIAGSRSSSASSTIGPPISISTRRESAPQRPMPRGFGGTGKVSPPLGTSHGMWAPVPSSLRLMDDGSDDSDEFGAAMPDFDQSRFSATDSPKQAESPTSTGPSLSINTSLTGPSVASLDMSARHSPTPPMFAGPIKIQTDMGREPDSDKTVEEVRAMQLGAGLGGLWGRPPPPEVPERFRDLSHTKRRWTVNERA